MISSRDELEVYIAILTEKVQDKMFAHDQLLDRLERLLRVLQRVAQESGKERYRRPKSTLGRGTVAWASVPERPLSASS